MKPMELLHEWYERIWVKQDLDAIDELFSPDAEAQGMMDFGVGSEDMHAMAAAMLAQMEVAEIRFDREVEMGNWAWASYTAHTVGRADGRKSQIAGQIMARVVEGKIVEAYNQIDYLSMLEQAGYLPQDTLALCLSGEGIGI